MGKARIAHDNCRQALADAVDLARRLARDSGDEPEKVLVALLSTVFESPLVALKAAGREAVSVLRCEHDAVKEWGWQWEGNVASLGEPATRDQARARHDELLAVMGEMQDDDRAAAVDRAPILDHRLLSLGRAARLDLAPDAGVQVYLSAESCAECWSVLLDPNTRQRLERLYADVKEQNTRRERSPTLGLDLIADVEQILDSDFTNQKQLLITALSRKFSSVNSLFLQVESVVGQVAKEQLGLERFSGSRHLFAHSGEDVPALAVALLAGSPAAEGGGVFRYLFSRDTADWAFEALGGWDSLKKLWNQRFHQRRSFVGYMSDTGGLPLYVTEVGRHLRSHAYPKDVRSLENLLLGGEGFNHVFLVPLVPSTSSESVIPLSLLCLARSPLGSDFRLRVWEMAESVLRPAAVDALALHARLRVPAKPDMRWSWEDRLSKAASVLAKDHYRQTLDKIEAHTLGNIEWLYEGDREILESQGFLLTHGAIAQARLKRYASSKSSIAGLLCSVLEAAAFPLGADDGTGSPRNAQIRLSVGGSPVGNPHDLASIETLTNCWGKRLTFVVGASASDDDELTIHDESQLVACCIALGGGQEVEIRVTPHMEQGQIGNPKLRNLVISAAGPRGTTEVPYVRAAKGDGLLWKRLDHLTSRGLVIYRLAALPMIRGDDSNPVNPEAAWKGWEQPPTAWYAVTGTTVQARFTLAARGLS